MEKKIKKSIILFSSISILCGWLGVLINTVLTKQPKGNSLGMLLWLVIPLLTAVLIRIFNKDDCKSLGLNPNFKGNLKWYLISFLTFPLITVIVLTIGSILKWTYVSSFQLNNLIFAFAGTFAGNLVKNIFEELAWRGFLTERLIKLNISDWKIYFIVSLVWGTWHIPYYLFFLSDDYIQGNRIGAVISIFVLLICWIIMFTEIYRLTRTIWPCVILHAATNSLIVINQYISFSHGRELFVSYDTGLISIILCICVGVCIRTYRKKHLNSSDNEDKLFKLGKVINFK